MSNRPFYSDLVIGQTNISPILDGTAADRNAIHRVGRGQEMRRNFRLVSVWARSMILMSSWETMLGTASIGLTGGGTAGLIWTYLVCWIGFICVNTSMAEMASMAPTSGGQYHWMSEFSPPQSRKFLSYLIGWLCVLGRQTGAANTAFLAGTQIQGLIALNNTEYDFKAWHATLLIFAVSTVNIIFNTFFVRRLPFIESIVLVVHFLGFFAIIVVLWVTGPISDARTTFTTFNNSGGSDSHGWTTVSGLVAIILPLLGADASVHISEALEDSSKTVPRSMLWTTLVNGSMGFVMLITLCFVLGSIDDALASPTNQTYLYVFYNSTQSATGATFMGTLVISMAIFCNFSITATSSRQLLAFARDQGVPFSSTFSYVSPRWHVPVNAIYLTFTMSCLLSLINLGSMAALLSIASLSTSAVVASYILSISCIALKRIRGESLLPSRFKLGRAGLPVNIISVVFLSFVFVFLFMPMRPRPDAANMNWSILMFGSTVLFSIIYYIIKGRHVYAGPVAYVRKSV